MLSDLLVPLVAVGLAELGDKTQLSVLLLASKTKKHVHLLLGVMLAFLVVDGFAVLLGGWITNLVSISLLKTFSGVVFILFGILILHGNGEAGESKVDARSPFVSGFTLVFLTEWGDKTQIASGLFATQYNPLLVLAGAVMALTLLSVAAVYLGKFVSEKVDKKRVSKTAGIVFGVIGLSIILF